jgi:pilus assembly protein CpaB
VTARRRRGLLLLSVALAAGGLAASQVAEREREVEERVGPLVPVLVAARDLPSGARLSERALEVRRVPARFVPPDAIGSAAQIAGARTAVPLGTGSYLTAGQLESAAGGGSGAAGAQLGPGERTIEVGVSGGGMLERLAPGARVDVVVSTEPEGGGGAGRTFVALADVQLLALRGDPAGGAYGAGDDEPSPGPAALATLRVTLRQAVYLTAVDNFGREIRLLARPPGDRTRAAPAVSAADL